MKYQLCPAELLLCLWLCNIVFFQLIDNGSVFVFFLNTCCHLLLDIVKAWVDDQLDFSIMLSAYGTLQRNNELFWTKIIWSVCFKMKWQLCHVTSWLCFGAKPVCRKLLFLLGLPVCLDTTLSKIPTALLLVQTVPCWGIQFWWLPVVAKPSFGFWAVERKILCLLPFLCSNKKYRHPPPHAGQVFRRDSGTIDLLLYNFGILNPFSCFSNIGFLRHHCESEVLNFTANSKFWTGYWALLANFRKVMTSKTVAGIKSTVLRKQTYTSVDLVDFFVWLFQAP